LEANPKANQTMGVFRNSQFRTFGVGYEVSRNDAHNLPEFTITHANFARYVQPVADQKCHYMVTLGGFRYQVFTQEYDAHP
jgi:hypothetical protein